MGFVPIEDRKDKDGVTHRRKVRLLETSLVSWPAYENAKLTNHRNNNQEETPMTEQAEKWTEALAKLTNRQDEQAEILRGIETTLTSRLNQQRGTSPLGEYHSQGELLKRWCPTTPARPKRLGKPTMRCCPVTTPVP